jgi:O-antigen/teichoic acid export membrane protein
MSARPGEGLAASAETAATNNVSSQEVTRASLKVRAGNAAVWALLDKWMTRALTTVVFVILARLLTPSELGIVALALIVRHSLAVFIDQGFSEAIVQAPVLERQYINTAFWTAISTGVFLALVTIVTAPLVANYFLGDVSATPLLRVLALSLVFTALSTTQSALLQRDLAFRELAIRRIVAQFVAGTAAIVAAFLGAGAWSIVLQTLLQGGIGAVILWHYSPWRPAFEFHTSDFRALAAFGISMLGIDILTVVQQQADNFLVGRSLGAAALGIYAVAFRFYFVIVDATISSVAGVALSTFSRVQQNLPAIRRAFLLGTRLTTIVALPFFAGMAVVAPEMILVVVGRQWDAAAPVLRALCPSGLILCLSYLDRSLMVALGRPRLALGITAVAVAVRLVGYLVGVQFGIVGVAIGLSVASITFWPGRVVVVARLTGLSFLSYLRQLAPGAFATGGMLATVLFVRSIMPAGVGAFGLLVTQVIVGAAVYLTCLAAADRASIRQLVDMARSAVSSNGRRGR